MFKLTVFLYTLLRKAELLMTTHAYFVPILFFQMPPMEVTEQKVSK